MTLPGDLQSVTVSGTYIGPGGTPRQGTVIFTPQPSTVASATTGVITLGPVEVHPDPDTGQFSVALLATDAAGVTPTGWTYQVTERWIDGTQARTPYSISLPAAQPAVELAVLAPTSVSTGTGTVSLLRSNNLADLSDPGAARTSLELGTAATADASAFDAAGSGVAAETAAQSAVDATAAETARAEAAEAALLPLAGGTLTGPLTLGGHPLTGLTDGQAGTDAATLGQVQSAQAAAVTTAGQTTTSAVAAETTRAQTAEAANAGATTAEATRAQAAESANASATAAETSRAQAAEAANTTAVATESARAQAAEAGLLPLTGGTLTGSLDVPRLTTSGLLVPGGYRGRSAPWQQVGQIITQYQSGHGATISGGVDTTNSNLNDVSDYCRGTQAAKVVFTGNGNLDLTVPSTDLTGKSVRFLVKVDNPANLSQLNIRIGTNASNVYQWQTAVTDGTNILYKPAEWTPIVVNWSDVHSAAGTFTLDASRNPSSTAGFTFIRFQIIASGAPVTVHFQAIEAISSITAAYPKGVVSVVFDDSWENQWTLGRPRMDQYGMRGTLYTIAQSIDAASRLTSAQLRSFQDLSGWEVAGHAYSQSVHDTRLTSFTAAQVDQDLRSLKAWMAQNGFTGDSYAYPGGNYASTTDGYPIERIVSRYFNSGRTVLSGYGSATNILKETWPPPRPYRLVANSAIGDYAATGGMDDPAKIVSAGGVLDTTKNLGAWLIMTFHNITTGTPGDDTGCSQAAFNTIMDGINSRGIPVLPVGDVMHHT